MNWVEIAEGIRAKVVPHAEEGILVLQGDFDPRDVERFIDALQKDPQWPKGKMLFLPSDAEFQAVTPEIDASLDLFAMRTHAQWRAAKQAVGVPDHPYDPSGGGCCRAPSEVHDLAMCAYADLSDHQKAERRNWVRWTLAALMKEEIIDADA